MQNYFNVDEISAEIGVNVRTIYQKLKILGIDSTKITQKRKEKLIDALKSTIERKKDANKFIKKIKNVKVPKSNEISLITGSTLEQRLAIAKREFDKVNKSLIECQIAIDTHGTIIHNGNNGTISSNPAVKTKCELLKQQNALQKTIQELEDRLKISLSTEKVNTIDDE